MTLSGSAGLHGPAGQPVPTGTPQDTPGRAPPATGPGPSGGRRGPERAKSADGGRSVPTHGPTIAVYRNIADSPDLVAELDRALAELAREHGCGSGSSAMEWEYLLVTARRSG